jgi:Flp pilus assembly pilin Flp
MLRLMLGLPNGDGSTSIEYAMIAAIVSIVIVGACTSIGQSLLNVLLGPVAAGL